MQEELLYIGQRRVLLKYVLPLSEVVVDLYDQIKSVSSGYARSVSLAFCNSIQVVFLLHLHISFIVLLVLTMMIMAIKLLL